MSVIEKTINLSDCSLLKAQFYVDGAWVGDGIDAVDNPATGEVMAKVPRFGEAETMAAVKAASRAFKPVRRSCAHGSS